LSDIESYNRQIVAEFRARGGRAVGPQGLSLLLLHHVGARSGVARVTPLAYWPLTDRAVAVVASNFGAPTHPAWYHNLLANPTTTVEIGTDTWTVRARVARPGERPTILDRLTSQAPPVALAVGRTSREIPLVILDLLTRRPHRQSQRTIDGTIDSMMATGVIPRPASGATTA
jgi:deazaflavin-dependent oxidoreductase (nitroreductase family)